MKKLLLFFAAILMICGISYGQTILIPTLNGGFESGSDFTSNGWFLVNGTATATQNQWYLGTAATAGIGSGNVAYITNNNATGAYAYTNTSAMYTVHFYRDVTFPAGETKITMAFTWKGVGETTAYDGLQVSLAPTTVTPTATSVAPTGSVSTAIVSGATYVGNVLYYNQSTAATATFNIPASVAGNSVTNSTMRVIFTFRMDGSVGTSPATAIDNISLTSVAPNPLNGSYTINNTLPTTIPMVHDGTGNFNNFSDAINYLNADGITSAVTFNVAAGQTFNENPPAITATGASGNTITFQKTSGTNPKITPTGTAGITDAGIIISGGDYITFDGIDIDASAVTAVEYGYLIRNASAANGAQYNTIKNCAITLNRGSNSANSSSSAIFQTASSTGGGVVPTIATGANSYNKYYNFTIQSALNGVYLNGNGSFRDLSCEIGTTNCSTRNIITNLGPTSNTSTSARGIYALQQEGVKIFNNDISLIAGDQAATNGIYFAAGYGTNNEIYNNKIHTINVKGSTATTASAYGIQADVSTATGTHSVRIYNNFVSNIYTSFTGTATATRRVYGIYLHATGGSTSQTYEVDNNSVSIGQGLTPTYSNTCIEVQNANPVYKIRGNVFANFTGAQGATAKHFGIVVTTAAIGGTGTLLDYNDYYIPNSQGTSGHVGRNNTTSTNYHTIADWKGFTTGTLDETSISVDPGYSNNNTDLHASTAGLNAVSGFSTQAWVTTDIDCQDRSTMSPADMGADAFNLNTLDMSASALASPLTPGCYNSSESVTITIKNNGTATVDFTVNPVTITTNVTGAATQSLSAVVNTGSLAAGLTQDVLMTTTLDMTVAGTYTFNAYTSVAGDGNTGNDAMSPATRTVIAPVALPHVQDFDASTTPPAGWNTTGWNIGTVHANPASGNGIFKNLYSAAPSGQIILPKLGPVSSSDVLVFDYRLVNYTSYPATALPNSPAWGSIVVEISDNCGVSYSTLATINPSNHVSSTNWATMTFPLSTYTGSSILLRINASWLAGDYYVDFDNIKIAAPPSCTAPSFQTVANVANNGADLSWTSPDSFFDIFIQEAATPAPGELTTPTADNVSGNSYTWTGGNAATSYYWWVRTDCNAGGGTGISTWTGPMPFTTLLCDPNNICNYTFRMTDAYGDGWNGNTMAVKQGGITIQTLAHTASGTAPVDLLVGLCDGVDFELFWNSGGTYPEEVGVEILNAFGTSIYYKAPGTGSQNTLLYTGTVNCTPPACPNPTDQIVSNITTSGADLSWTSAETYFDLYIVPSGSAAPTEASSPTIDNYIGNSLNWADGNINTAYDWYVRADCDKGGGTGLSAWAGPNTFKTECMNISLPYSEGFETMTSAFNCWSVMGNTAAQGGLNGDNLVPITGNTWNVCTPASFSGAGATYIHSGIRSAALGYTAPNFNWLISSYIEMPPAGSVNLKFWVWYHCTTDITKFYVNVLADGVWNTVLTYNSIANENQYASQVVVPLDAYIGKVIKVAFVYEYNDGWQLAVDDISIKIAPVSSTWTGTANSDWKNAANWSPDVPESITDVTIPAGLTNYPTLSSAASCNDITIQSSASGTGSILGNSFLTVSGTTTIERYLTRYEAVPDFMFHFLSSPVSAQPIVPEFKTTSSTNTDFYKWGESSNLWINTLSAPGTWNSSFENNFVVGNGYLVAYPDDLTKHFTGTMNDGDISPALSFTPAGSNGWNLIGNPYPSAIDWDLVSVSQSANLDNAVYVWDNANQNYLTWVGNAGSLTDGIISSMQGFFVKANAANPVLTLQNADRVHSGSAFYKNSSIVENLVHLRVDGNSHHDDAFIRFNNAATSGFDSEWDAYKLSSGVSVPKFYSMANDTRYSVNTLPESNLNAPVSLNIEVGADAEYTVRMIENTLSADVYVTLEDLKTGTMQRLNNNPAYTFTAGTNDAAERFRLHFKDATSVQEPGVLNGITVYATDGIISILTDSPLSGKVLISDMAGRTIITTDMVSGSTTQINFRNHTGVYLVSVITSSGTINQKILVR